MIVSDLVVKPNEILARDDNDLQMSYLPNLLQLFNRREQSMPAPQNDSLPIEIINLEADDIKSESEMVM